MLCVAISDDGRHAVLIQGGEHRLVDAGEGALCWSRDLLYIRLRVGLLLWANTKLNILPLITSLLLLTKPKQT